MSKKKEQVLDPNVYKQLILDVGLYEKMVREYKFKQMKEGIKGGELTEKIKECIDDILGVIRANLVENLVNELSTGVCMYIYENTLIAVMNDNTPPPIVVDEEKDWLWGKIKKYAPVVGGGVIVVSTGILVGRKMMGNSEEPDSELDYWE